MMKTMLSLIVLILPSILAFRSIQKVPLFTQNGFNLKSTLNLIELTNDGTITKEIVGKGQGKSIETGDILAIRYQAMIKGQDKPFAKSDKETAIVKGILIITCTRTCIHTI